MRKDLVGFESGKLVVIDFDKTIKTEKGQYKAYWKCKCSCGNTCSISTGSLIRKNKPTVSCGCLKHPKGEKHAGYKHGFSKSTGLEKTIYSRWHHIKERCNNPNYKGYGAKGIRVDEPWASDFTTFYNWFIEELAGRELTKYLQVDRFPDKNGNYGPANCRLATMTENARNKDNNKLVTVFGETLPLSEAVEKYSADIKYSTVQNRIDNNWDPERAIVTGLSPEHRPGVRRGDPRRPENYSMKLSDQERKDWLEYLFKYRSEQGDPLLEEEIKENLAAHLINTATCPFTIKKELQFDQGKADLAFLTDEKFVGYEIKSDGDDLNRFIRQQRHTYPYMFDECWLVVTEKHVKKAERVLTSPTKGMLVDCWGLMDSSFNVIRPAKVSHIDERTRLFYMLNRVWKTELREESKIRWGIKNSAYDKAKLNYHFLDNVDWKELRPLVRKYIQAHIDSKQE